VVAAQVGQLGPGPVVAHAHVVDDPLGLLLAAPQLLLEEVAAVDLVVGELPAGERPPVRSVGLQVGGPGHAVPEPAAPGPDHGRDRVRVDLGVEQELDVVEVVAEEVAVAQQVLDQRDPGAPAARVPPAVVAGVGRPVDQVGVLPAGVEEVDAEAVVVVPGDEGEIGRGHEAALVPAPPGVVEEVVGGGGEVVVPAADQDVHPGPAEERPHVQDLLDRPPEGGALEAGLAAVQAGAVDHPDEPGQVLVGVGRRVVPVGHQPVGLVVTVVGDVLAAVVVAVGPDPPLQGGAAELPAGRLVEVALVVVAEAVLQVALVHLLDDREQPHVGGVQPQLGIGVPRRRDARPGEQAPGQRLAQLRRVVVHGLEVDRGHAGQPLGPAVRLQVDLPGALGRPQRAVPAVDQGERPGLVGDRGRLGRRDVPLVGRVGRPQGQPGPGRAQDRLLQRLRGPHGLGRPAGDVEHVERLPEELVLGHGHGVHPPPRVQGRIGHHGPVVSAGRHIGDSPGRTLTGAGKVRADP
jgi:hypothetical protein